MVRPQTRSQARLRRSHIKARSTSTQKDNAVRTRLTEELRVLGIHVPPTLAISTLRSLLSHKKSGSFSGFSQILAKIR